MATLNYEGEVKKRDERGGMSSSDFEMTRSANSELGMVIDAFLWRESFENFRVFYEVVDVRW